MIPGGQEKRGVALARELEAEILRRDWPVGERIGNEAELIDRYGVSRAVLREAIRLLEHRQIALMRPGPGGGLVVNAPPAVAIVEVAATYFEFADVSLAELFEARAGLETVAARLAATRVSEAGVARLRSMLDDPQTGSGAALHLAIAELSANPALELFIRALVAAVSSRLHPPSDSGQGLIQEAHREVVDAVAAGDPGRAERALADHLSEVRWQERERTSGAPEQTEPEAMGKLPERLAHQIKAEISAAGWPVGQIMGQEGELLERYGVSRAVFREAVGILSYYGVAGMRRGPGGGLVVQAPDFDRVVDVLTLYLEFTAVRGERLLEARDAIELTSIALAAERLDSDGVDLLGKALAAEAAMGTDEINAVSHDLHLVIAGLSRNRPLELFTNVVTRATSAHVPTEVGVSPEKKAAIASEVVATHRRIVEAILAGDASLARRRMLRHLEALTPFTEPDADYLRPPRPRRGR